MIGKLSSTRVNFFKLLSSKWTLMSLIVIGTIIICGMGIFILPNMQNPVMFDHPSKISKSINKYCSNKILHHGTGNLVFSPFGAWTTLLFVASEGADENATKQLLSSIHSSGLQIEKDDANDVIRILNVAQNVPLKLAIKIFVDNKLRMTEAFGEHMKKNYQTDVQSVNFSRLYRACKTINDWVDLQTDIFSAQKDTVCPSQLSSSTDIVMVNAVGTWMTSFYGAPTTSRPFHLQNGRNISVPTMQVFGSFKYGNIPDIPAKIIELPYKQENTHDPISMSMYVIIPDDGSNLQDIERCLSELDLPDSFEGSATNIELYFPTFEQDSNVDLMDLNMTESFSHFKYFSRNSTKSSVKIDKIVQRSSIKFGKNCKGEPDVANIIGMKSYDHSVERTVLHADHPFLVFICRGDIVLYSIRVVDPSRDTDINKFGCRTPLDSTHSESDTLLPLDGISNSFLLNPGTPSNSLEDSENPTRTIVRKTDRIREEISTPHMEFK